MRRDTGKGTLHGTSSGALNERASLATTRAGPPICSSRWSGRTSAACSPAREIGYPDRAKLLADVVELRLRQESVSREEVRALWLGAALATHVGLAIFEEPERFVIAHEPAPLAA